MTTTRHWITLMSTAVLALTGCAHVSSKKSAAPKPHKVIFSITGQGHVASVTYVIDGKKTTERSVNLPWRKTVQVPPRVGGHTWDLKTHNARGTSTVVVYVDGGALAAGSCSGTNCDGGSSGSIAD